MIAYLAGTLFSLEGDEAIVLCGGVGYLLRLPTPTAGGLGPAGSPVTLWVHTAVMEDSLDVYGFASASPRPSSRGTFQRSRGSRGSARRPPRPFCSTSWIAHSRSQRWPAKGSGSQPRPR